MTRMGTIIYNDSLSLCSVYSTQCNIETHHFRVPVPAITLFITACKQSLGQGNVFTPVCHSVHRGWLPGKWDWLPSMHWEEGWLPSMHWEGGWLPSMHWEGGWLPSMHPNWEKLAVCIQLECFLVANMNLPCNNQIKRVIYI